MEWLRRVARVLLHAVDIAYHAIHRLLPAGPLLFVGRTRYRGPERRFADGTRLAPGDFIGTLHFNNARISELDAASPNATGLNFVRLMFDSLRRLAQLCDRHPRLRHVQVFMGIGWIRIGARVGFVVEPFPAGARRRYLAAHIRLLVWAFAPSQRTASEARPEPVISWLTRRTLVHRFGSERRHESAATTDAASAHSI